MFFLPNYPATTSWLSDEEKRFAAWRLQADVNEEDRRHDRSTTDGLRLALKDYRLYLFVLFQHVSLLSQTFQYFFPAIVSTLGYGTIDTLWLTAPVWVCYFPCPRKVKARASQAVIHSSDGWYAFSFIDFGLIVI